MLPHQFVGFQTTYKLDDSPENRCAKKKYNPVNEARATVALHRESDKGIDKLQDTSTNTNTVQA